jgi:hypothetical protein
MTLLSSPRTLARRLAALAAICALALALGALPAGAAKPTSNGNGGKPSNPPTSSAFSMTLGPSVWVNPTNPCAFDATYTWGGLKGGGNNLSVKLYDSTGAVIANTPQVQSLPSSGDFTFIFTFTGAPGPQRGIYARGVVLSNGVEVAGTAAVSAVTQTTCGSPISVGWVQTISLT